jgi:hypothetical protein
LTDNLAGQRLLDNGVSESATLACEPPDRVARPIVSNPAPLFELFGIEIRHNQQVVSPYGLLHYAFADLYL